MNEYRISKNREEIVKLFQKKFENENMLTMWQKDLLTGERIFKCEVKFYSFDKYEGTFSIEISQEQRNNFDSKLETYFLLNAQDFVFKTKSAIIQSDSRKIITFKIPYDIRLKELRVHPRVYIDSDSKRFVLARFGSKKDKSQSVEVACPIYNISKAGICIIVSKETLSSIKLNEAIDLEGLSFFESLTNEMKAVVKNARVYADKGFGTDEFYALGLEFQLT